MVMYPYFITFLLSTLLWASRILDDIKYFPYFDNCLGVLDGTHIPIHVPSEEQPRHRNRKGTLSEYVSSLQL
jgi:hypothetical protein